MSIPSQPSPPGGKLSNGYLFLPRPLARGTFLKWLRRTHAWLGLWGAALGLLFGSTGILLNHRDILKIPAAKTEQQETQLALPEARPADAKALAAWLGLQLGTDFSHARIMQEPPRPVTWNGVTVQQPARWQVMPRPAKGHPGGILAGQCLCQRQTQRGQCVRLPDQSAQRCGDGRGLGIAGGQLRRGVDRPQSDRRVVVDAAAWATAGGRRTGLKLAQSGYLVRMAVRVGGTP